jgi:hypothetical protein
MFMTKFHVHLPEQNTGHAKQPKATNKYEANHQHYLHVNANYENYWQTYSGYEYQTTGRRMQCVMQTFHR